MTPEQTAATVKDPISALGSGWMLSAPAKAVGKELGTGGWGLYMIGRGGVLGEVDPAVVTATFGFQPYERVRAGWDRGRAALEPAAAVRRFAGVCHEWARDHVAGADGLERLAVLLAKVAEAAPAAGLPLFAGWAAVPLPDEPAPRVAQLAHVLREHRGGCHLVAVLASGLTPLEAVLTGGGPGIAAFLGWPEPYADVSGKTALRAQAEALTDVLSGRAWGVLSTAEAAECAALARTVADHATASLSRA